MSHITDRINCPKCNTRSLRKSIVGPHNSKYSNQTGKEYFCDKDHEYFGIDELVNQWNYDLGDFGDLSWDEYSNVFGQIFIREYRNLLLSNLIDDSVSNLDESCIYNDEFPWNSLKERDEAYEVVTEMQLGIPAWEEGTTNKGIDIGLEGYPV